MKNDHHADDKSAPSNSLEGGSKLLPEASFTDLDGGVARNLLAMALSERGAVEDLLVHLASPKGAAWFQETLQGGCGLGLRDLEEKILRGAAGIEELLGIKDASKAARARDRGRGEKKALALAYVLAIAAALAHHSSRITSHREDLLGPVLLRLSRSVPEPWSELFTKAERSLSEGKR